MLPRFLRRSALLIQSTVISSRVSEGTTSKISLASFAEGGGVPRSLNSVVHYSGDLVTEANVSSAFFATTSRLQDDSRRPD